MVKELKAKINKLKEENKRLQKLNYENKKNQVDIANIPTCNKFEILSNKVVTQSFQEEDKMDCQETGFLSQLRMKNSQDMIHNKKTETSNQYSLEGRERTSQLNLKINRLLFRRYKERISLHQLTSYIKGSYIKILRT